MIVIDVSYLKVTRIRCNRRRVCIYLGNIIFAK